MFSKNRVSNIAASLVVFSASFSMGISFSYGETINSALISAYNNNPTINAQRAATRAIDEGVAIAKSGYRPTIFGNANYGLSRTNSQTLVGGVRTDLQPGGFGVTVSQTLWDSFLTQHNVSAANSGVMASREGLRNIEQNILFNGASAYLDVLRDRQILAFQKKNLSFLNEQVRSEQARFDVGEATRTDVAQARASKAAAQAQVSLAAANLKTSEGVYHQIIGNQPKNLSKVSGVDRMVPKNLNAGISIALNGHPAIQSTKFLVDQAAFNVKASESALLPTLSLDGQVSRNYEPSANVSVSDSASVNATLRVPIYQAGRQSAQIRQNKEVLGQREIEVDQSVDNVRAAVVSAYSQYEGARAALVANNAQLSAARLALEGAVEERKVGQRTTLDVLNTQTQVISAQIALSNSTRNLKLAGYAILSAIGQLNANKLGLSVASYEPETHYDEVVDKWFGLRTQSGAQ